MPIATNCLFSPNFEGNENDNFKNDEFEKTMASSNWRNIECFVRTSICDDVAAVTRYAAL